jgi:hypothetical protein
MDDKETIIHSEEGMDIRAAGTLEIQSGNKVVQVPFSVMVFQTMEDKAEYAARCGIHDRFGKEIVDNSAALFSAFNAKTGPEALFMVVADDIEARGDGCLYHESLHAALAIARLAAGHKFSSLTRVSVTPVLVGSPVCEILEEDLAHLMDEIARLLKKAVREIPSFSKEPEE